MLSKMPRWIWTGAWILACSAGFVNVIGLLSFDHRAITHLTGTTSLLAQALAAGDRAAVAQFLLLLGSFVTGAVASGIIVQDSSLQLGRRYGVALLLESGLFSLAVPLLQRGLTPGIYLAACGCGLQNAMVSTYSGTAIRTTHVSGMFTDLGISLGHALRGLPVDTKRLRMCVLIITGFLAGGVIGAGVFRQLGYAALYVPAATTAVLSLAYRAAQPR